MNFSHQGSAVGYCNCYFSECNVVTALASLPVYLPTQTNETMTATSITASIKSHFHPTHINQPTVTLSIYQYLPGQ